MQQAARLPLLLSQTSLPVPIIALFIGAALGVGTFAIADEQGLSGAPPKVIVVERPAPAGPGTAAKDEAAVGAAISPISQLRGSKASALRTPAAVQAEQAEPSRPAGPRGLAAGLSGR